MLRAAKLGSIYSTQVPPCVSITQGYLIAVVLGIEIELKSTNKALGLSG